jgi:hypothetical protein
LDAGWRRSYSRSRGIMITPNPTEIYLVKHYENGGETWQEYGGSVSYTRYGNGDTIWLMNGKVIKILSHNGLLTYLDEDGKWITDRSNEVKGEPS